MGAGERRQRSTYREGDLATFRNLFGKHAQEIQDACMASYIVPQGRNDRLQNVLPGLHLDGQDGQAHTQLDPHRLGPERILLEQD